MIVEFYCSVTGLGFLERLFDEFRAAGHTVAVVDVWTETEFRRSDSRFHHLWGRWLIYGWYPLKILGYLLCRSFRPNTVRITFTTPFYAPALVQLLSARRNIPTICLLYDLYPDALVVAGKLRPGGIRARLLSVVTRYTIKRSTLTVYLGARLKAHAERRYGPSRKSAIVPVGGDGSLFSRAPRPSLATASVRILYAGTMGYMHDTQTLLDLLAGPLPENIEFVFHSSGRKYEGFQHEACRRTGAVPERVKFLGPLPQRAWAAAMTEAPLALITMMPGSEKVVLPSKTYSALLAGQAILAVCPRDSDLAAMVLAHDCGWQVEPGDVEGLRAALESIGRDRVALETKRGNAYSAGHAEYDMSSIAGRLLHEAEALLTN